MGQQLPNVVNQLLAALLRPVLGLDVQRHGGQIVPGDMVAQSGHADLYVLIAHYNTIFLVLVDCGIIPLKGGETMSDFYKSLSEKEARALLAPLAAAVMASSSEVRKDMQIADGQGYEPWNVVREYESLIDMFYNSFKVIHDIQ